jgi:H+-translocating NAD(P) transhydrogenase subunit beta
MNAADTTPANWVDIAYLVTGVCFILGLRYLSSPKTAVIGNRLSAVGMVIAVVATLTQGIVNWIVVGSAIVVGAIIGIVSARQVKMTAMPQMVAAFNGAGGGAAALVAAGELLKYVNSGTPITYDVSFTSVLSAVIGALSFAGSIIAFLKLQEVMTGRPITYPGQQVVNALILLLIVVSWGLVVSGHPPGLFAGYPPVLQWFWLALGAALVLGVLFVLPIGGADMPVVISLLNSFTGLAAASTGFVLGNNVLIISGALVGASGTLLTVLMGKAMNRSITNVLFGAFGAVKSGGAAAGTTGGHNVRSVSPDDVAAMLAYANEVIVVPGYGMAVAQAQHSIRELEDQLEKRGVEVKYAIHPVAGRMPGHMNVLLAEANVPYESLYDMDDINPEFERADVALVVGANDVTNPAARTDKNSPIYGMPILDVDKAHNVVVLKRSMASGFAGIDNPLYDDPKTVMLFGDAKKSIDGVVAGVKAL